MGAAVDAAGDELLQLWPSMAGAFCAAVEQASQFASGGGASDQDCACSGNLFPFVWTVDQPEDDHSVVSFAKVGGFDSKVGVDSCKHAFLPMGSDCK